MAPPPPKPPPPKPPVVAGQPAPKGFGASAPGPPPPGPPPPGPPPGPPPPNVPRGAGAGSTRRSQQAACMPAFLLLTSTCPAISRTVLPAVSVTFRATFST
ncbi:MAG: hypothetical protein FJX72_09310, partial [Armatimonadetes bacterium]|nr:hypothetical protein [Armatimonadota bacterium]